MAFSAKDLGHVILNVWGSYPSIYESPCNVFFANCVYANEIESTAHVEALLYKIRKAAKNDDSPACSFSITGKEKGWKYVKEVIDKSPEHFQVVTTGSRHGRYKVMWVFFRTNGRKF